MTNLLQKCCDTLTKIENKLRGPGRKGLAGIWLDEHEFVEAAGKTHQAGYREFEAISPYPLHGIDDAIGLKRSFIPYVAFAAGLFGFLFGVWFTWYVAAHDWPLIIGGKPMWSFPAFIPVIFECTILFAALTSVAAMFILNGLPKVDPHVIDPDLTSHKFALFVPDDLPGFDYAKLEQHFRSNGAVDVRRTEF
jgi:hypothetical protein